MQRNFRNELILASAILFILVFAVIFAALLSNTPEDVLDGTSTSAVAQNATVDETVIAQPSLTILFVPTETATATLVPPTVTETPTATNTATVTRTPIPATATSTATETAIPATATSTATETAIPATATSTATETAIPATATSTATETAIPATATSTATETAIPATATSTATETAIPATATKAATATVPSTATHTPTATAIPPTATKTATRTPVPATATSTATATAIPPTNTATSTFTPTATPTATATITPSPSPTRIPPPTEGAFLGILPTPPPTPTVTAPDEPTRIPSTCEQPTGWTTYTVNSGDTLFAIAIATNSSLDELRYTNCIGDVDNITAGDVIFIPRAPLRPVDSIVSGSVRPGLSAIGCTDLRTRITSPISLQRVKGVFTVYGTATRQDFWYYKIEIRPDWADVYNFYMSSYSAIANGAVAQVNSEVFNNGVHWIRLSVVDVTANIQPDATCEIPVIFD